MCILCVHGSAINGEILESKTTKLRSLLPGSYEYEWPDGDVHVTPIKLLSDAYPGPYLSHVDGVTTDGIDSSISRLDSIIDEDGPFDGVLALCEGAMLVASLLFKHQMERPASPLPFRFAIFIAASLPFTWTDSVGHDVSHVLTGEQPLCVDQAVWRQQRKAAKINLEHLKEVGAKVMRDLTPDLDRKAQIIKTLVTDPSKAHLRPRFLHPQMHPDRLNLPTAHIWGRKDVLCEHSQCVVQLCNSEFAESYQHDEGHDVPQSWPDNEAMSHIKKTILRSEFAV